MNWRTISAYDTFEGGCTNNDCSIDGDRVCDTPPDNAQHTTCPFNSCSTDVAPGSPFSSDVNDFTGDFMDYSPFTCYNYFTADQGDPCMQTALETARKSLLESKACGDPCAQPIEALFLPGGPFSVGQTIALSNASTEASNYTWYFNDVAFSTLANPVFTIPTAGLFEIKLVVTNADPNCSDLFSLYATASCPVVADFMGERHLP